LLVFTTDLSNKEYQEQLKELSVEEVGLADRKLMIYQVIPEKYKAVDYSDKEANPTWKDGRELFEKYMHADDQFRVVLIGLDGTVKRNQAEVISTSDLFTTIDAMPMRKAEMRRKR